jgi:hypothetical protein
MGGAAGRARGARTTGTIEVETFAVGEGGFASVAKLFLDPGSCGADRFSFLGAGDERHFLSGSVGGGKEVHCLGRIVACAQEPEQLEAPHAAVGEFGNAFTYDGTPSTTCPEAHL